MRRIRRLARYLIPAALLSIVALATLPSMGAKPAEAATTWSVQAGDFASATLAVDAFLPADITIVEGDSVAYNIVGFHTVTLLSGAEWPPLVIPLADGRLALNPDVSFPSGDPTQYNGTGIVNSGAPADEGPSEPFSVTFTVTGTYQVVCLIHPDMIGSVRVISEGGTPPETQANIDGRAVGERGQLVSGGTNALTAATIGMTQGPGGSTEYTILAGLKEGNAEYLDFLPLSSLGIQVGDTVTWDWAKTAAPHTVTFTSGATPAEALLFEPKEAGPPDLVFNPVMAAPSGGSTYSGTGVFNSGLLSGPPSTYSLTFDTPGSYQYLWPAPPLDDRHD